MPQPTSPGPRWILPLLAGVLATGGLALAATPLPPAATAASPAWVDGASSGWVDAALPPVAARDAPAPGCRGTDLLDVVEATARDLAARRIPYASQPLSDCSGMAHRVLQALGQRCDQLDLPGVGQARSAEALAAWFASQARLVAVPTAPDADRWLVPGALAFFGRGDRVVHVGVVLEVERDEDGAVQSYAMFHGRQPGKVAGITRWHVRDADPALGNGPDALVAVAFPSPDLAAAAPALGGDPVGSALVDAWEAPPEEER